MTITKLSSDALSVLAQLCAQHSVTTYKHTTTRGASGAQIRAATKIADETCRIEPVAGRRSQELGKPGQTITHRLFFSSTPGVDPETQDAPYVLYGTRKFWVQNVLNVQELGQLWYVDCEERGDGQ